MIISRPKKERVNLAFVGIGRRGEGMLKDTYCMYPDVDITWLVDNNPKKLEHGQNILAERNRPRAKQTTDYREMLADPDVDAVVIYTGWDYHIEIALESMKAGKYTGVEVGTAYDISECYEMVRVYEETGSPLMMLENDCYARNHMMALNMARMGALGELVHCTGGYCHYLVPGELFKMRDIETQLTDRSIKGITDPKEGQEVDLAHYRQYEYANRCAHTYPTHEFGPIAKILRINRGNRLLTLNSIGSKSVACEQFLNKWADDSHPLKGKKFNQPDIVTTVMTCANGETVRLTLDTTLPRPYQNGDWTVRGTEGCFIEEGRSSTGKATIFTEGMAEPVENNIAEVGAQFEHPVWAEGVDTSFGHGGIDFLTNRAFIEAVLNGTDTPIDAYDTATWMAIGPLSEMSMQQGGAPVSFPDFTNGKWFRREPAILCKYGLDEIYVDEVRKNDLSHLKK